MYEKKAKKVGLQTVSRIKFILTIVLSVEWRNNMDDTKLASKARILVTVMAVLLAVLVAIGVFFAITITADAAQDRPLKIWFENENGQYKTFNLVDEDTGVNYIVVAAVSLYGDKTTTVAITTRLNADGSLYVTP
jgi:hypothetical protein